MPRKLHALLVGIDDYPAPLPRLSGCINDIRTIETWLVERVAGDPSVILRPLVLTNGQATRQAVVNGFREHLGMAGPDDVVLFYFSGHGSQELAPEEFWILEPDHLNETLVCYDSRMVGGEHWDLADKELALLIDEVGRKAGHVAVVLDGCHSGSGTRDVGLTETAVRRVLTDLRHRPLSSYLVTPGQAFRSSTTCRTADKSSGWHLAPEVPHVLLAACRDHQEAKEYGRGGTTRGVFSHFLTESLFQCGGHVTYRDLFARVASLVSAHVNDQSPQLETTDRASIDSLFLDGTIPPAATSYPVAFLDGQWIVRAGLVHGLSVGKGDQQVRFALFPFHASSAELSRLNQAVARARAVEVGPVRTSIEIDEPGVLSRDLVFKAVITDVPLPRIPIRLEGDDEAALQMVRQAIACMTASGGTSLFVRETEKHERPEFRVVARGHELLIVRPEDDRPLVDQIDARDDTAGCTVVTRLEHMARWLQTARLGNPATSLPANAVTLEVLRDGLPITDPVVRLQYAYQDGHWVPPTFQIKLRNNTTLTLFCGLLNLTETFKISTDGLMASGCIRLEAGQEAWAFGGRAITATIPNEVWQRGVTEYRDILKLIVCTREFDARELTQPSLDQPRPVERSGTRGYLRNSTLCRLIRRVQTRDLSWGADTDAQDWDDWTTSQLTFITVRATEAVGLPEAGGSLSLVGGLQISGHGRLRAHARLLSDSVASRDVGNLAVPALLRNHADVCAQFALASKRSSDPLLNVLELSEVHDYAAVTPDEPLVLRVPTKLSLQEHLLPVGFDGEFYLPLGFASRQADGSTQVVLQRLTDPISQGRRSLIGSIRIFFHKVLSERLSLPYPYPILAAVTDASEAGRVTYDGDPDSVKRRVAAANHILILIHGILGDTRVMASCTRLPMIGYGPIAPRGSRGPSRDAEGGTAECLADVYDLILAFDYENLNTPIPEIARQLKQRLAAVGLARGHGKRVDLVAHCMGGLVSRWFIERDGGNQIIERLVMLGTPNGGSPWATLQDWATTALTIGLNAGWIGGGWPVAWLGALVVGIEKMDISFDQLKPGADFLRDLEASPEPGIPYFLIAGNTSLIPAPFTQSNTAWWERLWDRLTLRRVLHGVTAPAFFGQPNDIAVSVHSMQQLATLREPAPSVLEVGCDHLSYFTTQKVVQTLQQVLGT